MSGFLAVCVRLSLHRGRGWEGEVSKWFLFCSCLVFSRSFVHDCKTAKCFQKQGEPKFGQIRVKSKATLKFDISRLCSQTFNYITFFWYLLRPHLEARIDSVNSLFLKTTPFYVGFFSQKFST